MLRPDQVPSQIEKIGYSRMRRNESLSLPDRIESTYSSLPDPSRLVRLLGSVIGILTVNVNRLRDHLPMGNWIALQLIGQDLPGFCTVTAH